jgi:hypothetical protein
MSFADALEYVRRKKLLSKHRNDLDPWVPSPVEWRSLPGTEPAQQRYERSKGWLKILALWRWARRARTHRAKPKVKKMQAKPRSRYAR